MAFCPACQAVTYLGLAEGHGYLAAAQAPFIPGNNWTEVETATSPIYVRFLDQSDRRFWSNVIINSDAR